MSRMYLAAAGSGKTTFLLDMVADKSLRYLYTTFTNENSDVAKAMLVEKYGCVPSNVVILPWFSFLLEHGVRPFQGSAGLGSDEFVGVDLSSEGKNYNRRPSLGYYCNLSTKSIYAAKLPELVLHCDDCSGGAVFRRLGHLFDAVLIDEAQDLAGYDYEVIKRLLDSNMDVQICGDERQTTYRTSRSKKYKGKTLEQFLSENGLDTSCVIDRSSLSGSYRCDEIIIQFANRLYPGLPQTKSLAKSGEGNQTGIWLVPASCVEDYVVKFNPVVLRDKATVKTVAGPLTLNFGKSKGRTFDDVLIYPVKAVKNWLADASAELRDQTRSRFYVAVTRARHSVGIVVSSKEAEHLAGNYRIWGP